MDSDQQGNPQLEPGAAETARSKFPGVEEIYRLLGERRELMDQLAAATDDLRASNDRLERRFSGSDGDRGSESRDERAAESPKAIAPTQQSAPNPILRSLAEPIASSPAKTVADRLPLTPASLLGLAGSGVALMVVGGLALLGIQGLKPEYRVETPRPLTVEEAALLDWAQSPEGQQARELMRWNSELLDDRSCEQEVERLGVTLELQGKLARSGFCNLWVVPPEERRFD